MHTSPRARLVAAFGTAGIFLGIAALGWALLRQSEAAFSNFVMPGDPGPFFLARLCLAAIFLAGLVLALHAVRLLRRAPPAGQAPRGGAAPARWLLPAGFTLSLLAMPALMTGLGTTLAVFLFSCPWILILHGREARLGPLAVAGALAASGAAAGFVSLVFIRLLNVPLPT
ncbi:hypothetical protein [Aureimonas populi]|uniref:Tripartite tricarboxylate transporter TctB family protein n=1 Tax=Aureimonas populi TaxID=1701758 RepID=A0ABW5CND7_9HYPH|nr:hypothetical protein [Aureimonas populi]